MAPRTTHRGNHQERSTGPSTRNEARTKHEERRTKHEPSTKNEAQSKNEEPRTKNLVRGTLSSVKLTVTVITRDESAHIAAALQSVRWADEIIVVDSGSTDDTVAIARQYATRVE